MIRVLFLRFSSLGDIILSNYSAMKLKKKYPEWEVTWLVDSLYADIVKVQPWINKVMEWNRKKDGNLGFVNAILETRHHNFDILLDMHDSDRSNLFSLCSGIPVRYCAHSKYPFTHTTFNTEYFFDTTEKIFDCHKYLYAPHVITKTVLKTSLPRGHTVALAIGASYSIKRWPVKMCRNFCEALLSQGETVILLGAGHEEIALANEIMTNIHSDNVINFVGKLSTLELLDVIDASDVTVAGDTGILHIARALGKPVVGLFGPSVLDELYMKSLTKCYYCTCPDLGCENWDCKKQCMTTISPENVFVGVENILSGVQ